ncbi:MAG: hypothetical protein AMS19_13940, partial [Gemmatimonas sp. SG8_23]
GRPAELTGLRSDGTRVRGALAGARMRAALLAALVVTQLAGFGAPAAAQQRPGSEPMTRPEIPPALPISPGGAFWRALLVPGWGHAAIGSYVRGGVYVAAQAATLYSFASTRLRLNDANRSLAFREEMLRRELEGDPVYSDLQLLVESREAQQEDLLAFSIFLVLLSSADAYVSAHLARFPEPLDVEARPSPSGGLDLGLKVALPN